MTRAQKDFAVLVINRQIQNRVLSAFDTNLQMLLQGSQLSPGTAEQSLTHCLADSMRTTFSLESKNLPATVSQQGYTDMINAIRLVASQKPENIVAKLNWDHYWPNTGSCQNPQGNLRRPRTVRSKSRQLDLWEELQRLIFLRRIRKKQMLRKNSLRNQS